MTVIELSENVRTAAPDLTRNRERGRVDRPAEAMTTSSYRVATTGAQVHKRLPLGVGFGEGKGQGGGRFDGFGFSLNKALAVGLKSA